MPEVPPSFSVVPVPWSISPVPLRAVETVKFVELLVSVMPVTVTFVIVRAVVPPTACAFVSKV